ncbi:hypothetical protein [Streptomyces sp. NPDC057877]|uniref:hypothetical protein n=1 Tax=Streptomyces sp. NPDC057877 TaxID=3346269 RepID=UPI0036A9725F
MTTLGPLPGIPRWTGVKTVMTGPSRIHDGVLTVTVTVRITSRARMWALWRMLTEGG